MKQTACKLLFLLAITPVLTGCGTIVSMAEKDYSVYGGVSRDFEAIREGGLLSVAAVIDLPLSFVLDTLLLPVTLSR